MKIVIFGATGNVGRPLVKEALTRGHQVVGVIRDPQAVQSADARVTLRRGDATDRQSVAELARGADAVVSAVSPRPSASGLPAPTLVGAARAVIAGLRDAGTQRVVAVGGAGSLEIAPGKALVDQPGFPDMYKAEALDGRASLKIYREEAAGLDWTFISPAIEIAPGERTGRYRTTIDQVLSDANGKSFISFEDFAVAILDELERPKHIGRRFGVAY